MKLLKRAIRETDGFRVWLICTLALSAVAFNVIPELGQKVAWAIVIFFAFCFFCVLGFVATAALQAWASD